MSACSSSNTSPPPDTSTLPPAPQDERVPVAFGLKRDFEKLAKKVQQISDPNDESFRSFLTASQIADEYGASVEDSQAALAQLSDAGFEGSVDPTRGIITGTMTVADAQDLLNVSLVVFTASDGTTKIIGPTTSPDTGGSLPDSVTEVVGLTKTLSPDQSGAGQPSPATGVPSGCIDLPNIDYLTRGQFGLNLDAGTTNTHLAMLEVDIVDPGVLDYLSRCYQLPVPSLTVQRVAGTEYQLPSALESDLDLAVLAVANQGISKISTFAFDPSTSIVFAISDAVTASFAPDGPSILTTSVGFCEDDVSDPQLKLGEWLLAAGSAGGLTTIAATGDNGSTACEPGRTSEETQYPASSVFVTGVGGTEFAVVGRIHDISPLQTAQEDPASTRIPGNQVVWNGSGGAGGGATSSRIATPWYQSELRQSRQRLVPDVAYLASPFALSPLLLCNPTGNCQRNNIGGTSAAAPGFAAAIASIAANLAESPGPPARLGLLNPSIYAMVGQDTSTTLDITTGNNDILNVGCCQAQPGYDPASGWGSVNVADLEEFISKATVK